jgi:3'-phosphoadenosine 5'-phosphosulfate sulfotransferase (PAPS reductase)/FAD synthetase
MIHVVSLSGGKDSVALRAWAGRVGLSPLRAVACDTKWEFGGAPGITSWREYIASLEKFFGPITIVSGEGFENRVARTGTFPGRTRRWCTPELKIEPFRVELDRIREETGDDVTVLVGIRAEESNGRGDKSDRATWPEREWSEEYDCEVVRPLLKWTLADVIAEHHRAGIPLNPLYLAGAERVDCWPCINAGKTEIEMVARLDPARIDSIRAMEESTGFTMFTRDRRTEKRRAGDEGPSVVPVSIDEAVAWSRTSRGGKHLTMYPEPSGCMRWGICEPPVGR